MKIYTRSGDGGLTGLGDGSRVGKDHARVAAYGDVDELNACVGVAAAHAADPTVVELLTAIQGDLFAIGAQLADPRPGGPARAKAALPPDRVASLEAAIDARDAGLPPLTSFILPAGTPAAAFLHVARTVCRRAERAAVALGRAEPVDPAIVVYLNRLSDLLFVLARDANRAARRAETKW
jgi:cob(I)alamin adenosyltransferase